MTPSILLAVLLLAPVVGFLINGIGYRKNSANVSATIATLAVFVSFGAAVALFATILSLPEESRRVSVSFFDWITVDTLKLSAGFVVDQISGIMILIITGVGTLIHLFSAGYMHHDKGVAKYFAYLNLFIFNMLILVLGDSLPVMFVGWEGVGLCSYLLIGFWFTDSAKAAAGMKAFVTNRIGDAAFLLGMFVLFMTFGTLNFQELIALVPTVPDSTWTGALTIATMLLFIGATGKSAQIPLYVWLPDAMAGPTPVSALIHAATMVTAGVYMIVRLNPLFSMAPNTMMIIAIIGAATAVVAATIGVTQNDIKKVLAYSTVSQLGYMFLACGVGAYGAAMFHLMTHAFFKALMFLGSGSVIHAMHEEQDIRKMGALKKYLPWTHATFLMGWLAIIGMPPFAGFFSKDEILAKAFESSPFLWAAGALGATLTAFYMTRLMALTFWGESRVPKDVHPHESPAIMVIPLVVLAILSVIGGWIGIPQVIGEHLGNIPNVWEHWLEPLIKVAHDGAHHLDAATEWALMGGSVSLAGISAAVAYKFYSGDQETPKKIQASMPKVYDIVNNKYYVDEIYFGGIINPLIKLSKGLWAYVDVKLIDKTTYVVADMMIGAGGFVRGLQNGNMQQYAMYIGLGVVAVVSFIIMR